MSWSMGCFPKQKSKHHCLTSLFGSHLPRRHSWRGRFCRFGSQSSRAALPPWYPFAWVRKGRASCPQASSCPTWRYKKLPCFGGAFLLLVSPATTGGSPRAPHPQQGFPGAILPSVPHRGGFFPGEIGNKLLFQKKFGKSRAVGCMFMQKLERTFAMKTQLPGAKARAGGGVGEIPGVWAFSGPVHFACVLKVYAPGLQNIPEIPGKFRKINV